jgi:mercuric ion transport protein
MTADSEARRLSRAAAVRKSPALASGLLLAGGAVSAVAASSCCLVPLALFLLGIGGAWIGNLTRVAPYQPYFLGAAAACLGAGYWRVWRTRRSVCGNGEVCARRRPGHAVFAGLVVATVLVAAALALDLIAPFLLTS